MSVCNCVITSKDGLRNYTIETKYDKFSISMMCQMEAVVIKTIACTKNVIVAGSLQNSRQFIKRSHGRGQG